jgi:hypothetical protein
MALLFAARTNRLLRLRNPGHNTGRERKSEVGRLLRDGLDQ